MSTPYNVITRDLATVVAVPQKIAQTNGKQVRCVSVTAMPAGQVAYIRIGNETADRIALSVNKTLEMDPAEEDGIFYENPTAGAGTVELTISYQTPCPDGTKTGPGLVVVS